MSSIYHVAINKRKVQEMRTLRKFEMENNRRIEFLLKDLNEYGYFSDLTIEYYVENKKIQLFDDFVVEGVRTFRNFLQKCINGEKILPAKYFEKGIGYQWDKTAQKIAEGDFSDNDAASSFLLWESVSGIATWMYNYQGQTYLEISTQYKYNYSEPDDDFISFETYLSNYKIVDRVELELAMIAKWYEDVNVILNKLDD